MSNLFYACRLPLAAWPGCSANTVYCAASLLGPGRVRWPENYPCCRGLNSGDLHLRLINMKGKNAFIKHNIIMGFYLTMSIENA